MSHLVLDIPKTLRHQLETLAQSEGVPLGQYIVFALTRQATLAYAVQAVPEKEISQQRNGFEALLQSLGQASFDEIEQVLLEREPVAPEEGLTPEVVQRLQAKIESQQAVH